MVVRTAGSSNTNEGNITASSTGGTQHEIDANEGVSQCATYTVPLGKRALLYQVELNADRSAGGTAPNIEFHGLARPGGADFAFLQLFDKRMDTSLVTELDVILPFPTLMTEKTDIRIESDTDQNSTETRVRIYLLVGPK